MNITVPAQFWEPLRKRVIRNVVGAQSEQQKPLVLYVSRQGGKPQDKKRRLLTADHLALVSALEELQKEHLCEVEVVQMEKISLVDQLKLVSRSTVSFDPFWFVSSTDRPTFLVIDLNWSSWKWSYGTLIHFLLQQDHA